MPGRDRLRVGFVTIWFERGQSYVTRLIRDSIAERCRTFVFARTGGVNGQAKLETQGFWQVPDLTTYPDYQIPPAVLQQWIRRNRLDVVVFNEEYDFSLVAAAKQAGAKAVTYLDYYKEDWKPYMGLYDAVLCSSRRAFELVKDFCPAHYMGWAVDSRTFRPRPEQPTRYTFFHNAGWLGIGYRKMTPACILAFDAISRHLPEATLLVHAQSPLEMLPPVVQRLVQGNPRITYRVETVPAPGLYHLGRIMVMPTKLEGLGLPLFEALACGLPVIVTDAPPMNEFIVPHQTGLLVRVARRVVRQDNIAFPEELVDVNHLAETMAWAARHPEEMAEMSRNARLYAEQNLRMDELGAKVLAVLQGLFNEKPTAQPPIRPLAAGQGLMP